MIKVESDEFAKMNSSAPSGSTCGVELQASYRSNLCSPQSLRSIPAEQL